MIIGSLSFPVWIIRKFAPFLIGGSLLGIAIAFLEQGAPRMLRYAEISASVIFGGLFAVYLWWAVEPSKPEGYAWTLRERLGIVCSAIAVLILSLKFGFESLPGPIWGYVIVAVLLAFVARPALDLSSYDPGVPEQSAAQRRGKPRA